MAFSINFSLTYYHRYPTNKFYDRRSSMKYMLTWNERPQGSPMEYENAQKRILEVFTQWKAPDNFKIEMFVIRVGEGGAAMQRLLDNGRVEIETSVPPSKRRRPWVSAKFS